MPDGNTPDPRETPTPNPAVTARPGGGGNAPAGDGSSTSEFIRGLLGDDPAFGTSGIDFANTLAQIGAGGTNGQVDPRLAEYYSVDYNQGGENPTKVFTPTSSTGPNSQGMVMIDGVAYIQLGGATDNTTIKSRDPSMFKKDPKWGLLTPASNVQSGSDPFSDIAPWAMLAVAGAGAAGAFGGGGAALDVDTSLLPSVTAPTLPELAPLPEVLAPGVTAGAGAGGGAALLEGVDTSALPAVTAPTLPDLAPLPEITSGIDTSLLPAVTAPELGPLSDIPSFVEPGAGAPLGAAPDFVGPETPNTMIDGVSYGPGSTIEGPIDTYDSTPGFFQNALDVIKANPLQTGGLALSAVSQVMANKRARDAASQLRQAAQPISDEAKALFDQYGKGQLNPADEFRINQWEQAQIAKAQGLYGNNSTAANNAVQQIQAQAEAMRSTALEGLLKAGLQASGMALGPLTQAIEAEGKDDAQFAAATANALRALTLLGTTQGGGGGGK